MYVFKIKNNQYYNTLYNYIKLYKISIIIHYATKANNLTSSNQQFKRFQIKIKNTKWMDLKSLETYANTLQSEEDKLCFVHLMQNFCQSIKFTFNFEGLQIIKFAYRQNFHTICTSLTKINCIKFFNLLLNNKIKNKIHKKDSQRNNFYLMATIFTFKFLQHYVNEQHRSSNMVKKKLPFPGQIFV